MIFTLSCIFRYLQIPNRAGTGVQYRTECHGRRGRDTVGRQVKVQNNVSIY